jgi:hypothetical protein
LSSPLAIQTLRAGYLLPAFALLAPDLVVPDCLDLDFEEPDFDLWVDFELGPDLLRERGFALDPDFALLDLELLARYFELLDRDLELLEPDLELREPDLEPLEPDLEPLEPDLELLEPDLELLEPDLEPLEPAFELPPRELELPEPRRFSPDSESVVGGSGGRAAGSTCLVRSVPVSSGGGSL